jgi:hypothetical protein
MRMAALAVTLVVTVLAVAPDASAVLGGSNADAGQTAAADQ